MRLLPQPFIPFLVALAAPPAAQEGRPLRAPVATGVQAASGELVLEIVNVGLACGQTLLTLDGDLVALPVFEAAQGGLDLNGDGDTFDAVQHVYDARRGRITNLERARAVEPVVVDGGISFFLTSELAQGGTDLNADGDALDNVLTGYDARSGVLFDLGWAGTPGTFFDETIHLLGDVLIHEVPEPAQGAGSLNADGDVADRVLRVQPLRRLSILAFLHEDPFGTPLGVARIGSAEHIDAVLGEDLLIVGVSEKAEAADLNGDGDAFDDDVLHAYDLRRTRITNLAISAAEFERDGDLLLMLVSELLEATDLNGDGDKADEVVHVLDLTTNVARNLGLDATEIVRLGQKVFFDADELRNGATDLNGDGDFFDDVLHVYDLQTGATTNLGLDARYLTRIGTKLAFAVDEADQGAADLNGDLDATDSVLHFYDVTTGTAQNLAAAVGVLEASERLLAVPVVEAQQLAMDFNGDGDAFDTVLIVYDAVTEAFVNTGLALSLPGSGTVVVGERIAVQVAEQAQGNTDLNGDGDADDATVVFFYDAQTAACVPTGLVGHPVVFRDDLAAFPVREELQGNADLNGDGDSEDFVLHVVRLK